MLLLRSILFNILFVIITFLEMVCFAPIYFLLPRKAAWFVPKFWAKTVIILLKYIAGTGMQITGLENIAKIRQMSKSYIIAAKHQSAWETFALLPYLDEPSYVLKRELMWIPFFGWFMAKVGMIAINRGSPLQSLKKIVEQSKVKIAQSRQILIFPEGTRTNPGDAPNYKSAGVTTIYRELNIPVLPIAHNAGLYWGKGDFRRYPGVIKVEILPPIQAGLDKKLFMDKMVSEIESSSNKLILEAAIEYPSAKSEEAANKIKSIL